MKGAEYAKMGTLINIKENFCIYVYKYLTLIQEQKYEADLANSILHLSKITVGTPRHMPHHNNTDYTLTRVQLTFADTGLNYSFSHATE
jgi:ABC-type cobalamin transport system ATPase subunit